MKSEHSKSASTAPKQGADGEGALLAERLREQRDAKVGKKKFPVKLAVGLGILAALAVSLVMAVELWADFPQQAAKSEGLYKELVAAGYPTKIEQIVPTVKPGQLNLAPFMAEATLIKGVPKTDMAFPFTESGKSVVKAEQAANQRFMDLIDDASRGTAYVPSRNYTVLSNVLFPDLATFKYGVRALSSRAIVKAMEGDSRGALEDMEKGFNLADRVRDEPFLIQSLVGIACNAILYRQTSRLATLWKDDPKKLDDLRKIVAKQRTKRELRQVMRSEFLFSLDSVRNFRGFGGEMGFQVETDPKKVKTEGLPSDIIGKGFMGPILQFYKEWDKSLASDAEDFVKGREGDKIAERIGSSGRLTTVLLGVLSPVFTGAGDSSTKEHVTREMTIAYLDVLARQASSGRLPTEGEAVSMLPHDRFGNEKVRYARTPAGFKIWSVGANLKDDGGDETLIGLQNPDLIVVYPPLPDKRSMPVRSKLPPSGIPGGP